ncbi:MAG: HEAT repeat domain-containing protein, partial [Chloroflexota bacterium]
DTVKKGAVAEGAPVEVANTNELIERLTSRDGIVREDARRAIVKIGKPAVRPLLELLASPSVQLRWEAAKALADIGDPVAAPALVNVLDDEEFAIRWLAAEGLIMMGTRGLPALLRGLERNADSIWLREAAHHILHDLRRRESLREGIQPVLEALEGPEPADAVPYAARAFRERLMGV